MAIPEGYDLFHWFNEICGKLNEINMKLVFYKSDWQYFTDAQKTAIKSRTNAVIDQAITDLTDLKNDINNVEN